MSRIKLTIPILVFFGIAILFSNSSCDERNAQRSSNLNELEIDSTKSSILNVGGELFSIPSPIQTAILINRDEAFYMKSELAQLERVLEVPSRDFKALNLGLCGIDMVYASYFNDAQTAISYYKLVDELSNQLEIKGAIDPKLIERVGNNAENPDSLIYLSSTFYEEADAYLKENERPEIAILILTGAWIESSYLTSKSEGGAAKSRLAEQKGAAATLANVLNAMKGNESLSNLLASFDSLNASFLQIEKNYEYRTPEVNIENKTTTINSATNYNMSDSIYLDIKSRLEGLHSLING